MTADAFMPSEIARSPLGDRMHTFIRHLRSHGVNLSSEERSVTWSNTFPGFAFLPKSLARWSDQLGEFVIDGYERADSFAGAAQLTAPDGRGWRACVVVDEIEPHLIVASAVFSAPEGVRARLATAADVPVMREIERRTPIADASSRTYYDRGKDYLAGERLMGDDVEMFVVERDGRIVGLGGRAFPPVRVAGHVYRGLYSHRLRLLPEAQGEGVLGPLNAVRMLSKAARHCLSYSFVAERNEAAIRSLPGGEGEFWPLGAARLTIDTAVAAAPPAGRPSEASDARRLVELFNLTHRNEELFVPYTEETLTMRMLRAPDVYSWRHVLIGERAALGVWPAGLGVRREEEAGVTSDVRALVLDYGCEPDAEDTLLELISAAAGSLKDSGTTELSIFCSEPSPAFPALSRLAKRIEPYIVRCAAPPDPELEQRGVYVDQLYF
jgi:hypothetical protein